MFAEDDIIKFHRRRAAALAYIITFCFLSLIFRLWFLQIYKGETLHQYSVQNRLRKEIVRAPRGRIYSKDNKILVDNFPRFDAILTRQFLRDKKKTIKRLSKILDIPVKTIQRIIRKSQSQAKYIPIIIKKNISSAEIALIETENSELPGVSVNAFISREYMDKEVGAHALGYISEISQDQLPKFKKRDNIDYRLGDFIGQFGIEEQWDRTVRGSSGHEYVEVDALGRKNKYINTDNLFKGIEDEASQPGKSLRLTIDSDMQKAGYNALIGKEEDRDKFPNKVGSVVAIDVKTGEILAMVSNPAFDPSQFSKGLTSEYWSSLINDPNNPLRDRVIQEHYSPGSTFKPFTAIAALEEGIISENSKIRCHGTFRLGRRVYHSWQKWGTKKVDVVDALMQSCNIFFYKVAAELDIDVLAKYAKLFGLGTRTGIKLPREVSGLIPDREWKLKRNGVEWQLGETLSCAIGQSYVLTSTLQLAIAYSAIANEGKVFKPIIVKEILDQEGKVLETREAEVTRNIKLKQKTWDLVKRGLYKVMNNPKGTGWWRRGYGLDMAGKTGTAQVMSSTAEDIYDKCEKKPYEQRHHGIFVGFAPFDDPQIAVASMVEHGCHGSSAAAPVVAAVIEEYMKKYLPEKKKIYEKKQSAQYREYIAKKKEAAAEKEAEAEAESAGEEE